MTVSNGFLTWWSTRTSACANLIQSNSCLGQLTCTSCSFGRGNLDLGITNEAFNPDSHQFPDAKELLCSVRRRSLSGSELTVAASKPTFDPAAGTAISVDNARGSCRSSSQRVISHHERPVHACVGGSGGLDAVGRIGRRPESRSGVGWRRRANQHRLPPCSRSNLRSYPAA